MLEGLPNKVMGAEYQTALPDEEFLASKIRYAGKMPGGTVASTCKVTYSQMLAIYPLP